jgi:hypothetical protein
MGTLIMRTKLGIMERVRNKDRKTSANAYYYAVWLNDLENLIYTPLMLTQSEFNKATERARKNKEDMPLLDPPYSIPNDSLWTRILKKFQR